MTIEEAIEIIKETRFDINTKVNGTTRFSQALEIAIEALDRTKWIPVSEKLPGEDICEAPGPVWKRKVLITGYYSWNCKEDTFIGVAFARDVKNNSIPINVIAWMPYPEIYKESEE